MLATTTRASNVVDNSAYCNRSVSAIVSDTHSNDWYKVCKYIQFIGCISANNQVSIGLIGQNCYNNDADEDVRVTVTHKLGCKACEPHTCVC